MSNRLPTVLKNGRWVTWSPDIVATQTTKPSGVCEDDSGTPHKSGSIEDVPLWHPGERKAYGAFAEAIEMDDEMRHAYD